MNSSANQNEPNFLSYSGDFRQVFRQIRLIAVCSFFLLFSTTSFSQIQIGQTVNGLSGGDRAGDEVAISADGSRIAIGASVDDGSGGVDAGSVRIFEYDETLGWSQLGSTIEGVATDDYFGYALDMSADGNRVAIGAYGNDGSATDAGHIRIYDWNGSAWVQVGSDLEGENAGDWFGVSVSISADGNRLASGAWFNDGGGVDAGHVRVFDWNGSEWQQVGEDLDGENPGDWFGSAVALSSDGNRLVASARQEANASTDAGYAKVLEWDGQAWNHIGNDIEGAVAGDIFGFWVDIDALGNRVAVGSLSDDNGNDAGQTKIFEFDDENWTQLGQEINGENSGDASGRAFSLSADGNRIVIGELFKNITGSDFGQARIFDWTGFSWIQRGEAILGESSFDEFGRSVALTPNGNRVVISARGGDNNGPSSGEIRIFNLDGLEYPTPPGSGDALVFDNTNNSVRVTSPENMTPNTGSLSLSVWIKKSTLPSTLSMVMQRYGFGGFDGGPGGNEFDNFSIFINSDGSPNFAIRDETSAVQILDANTLVVDGEWHHLCGIRDVENGEVRIYVDGVLKNTQPLLVNGIIAPSNDLLIGASENDDSSALQYFFDGTIDEASIWIGAALSEEVIRDFMCQKDLSSHPQLANLAAYYRFDDGAGSTTLQDLSGNGNDGTLTNMDPTTDWVTSGAPIGDVSAQGYGMASVSLTDGTSLTADNLTGNPDGVHVYKVNEAPNDVTIPSSVESLETSEYYGVHVVGGTDPTYSFQVNYSSTENMDVLTNELSLLFASRENNAAGAFLEVASQSLDAISDEITASNQSGTEYILGFKDVDCLALGLNIDDPCDDNDATTEDDAVNGDCECLGVSIFDCPDLEANIGEPCNDDNPNTENDIVLANCTCLGTEIPDCPLLGLDIGESCNDGDPTTENDVVQANCECEGTSIFDCPALNADIGDPCNDGDPSTENDIIQSDCSCAGTPTCTSPFPAVDNSSLSAFLQGFGYQLNWAPVPNQIGCQVAVRFAGGNLLGQQIVSGANVQTFFVPGQFLQFGTSYEWRVRCGCSQSPLVVGPWSAWQGFTTPGGAAITSSPNPTEGISQVSFSVAEPQRATLEVMDMNGRVIEMLFSGMADLNSDYRFEFDGSGLPSGVYLYRLTTEREVVTEKILILK